MSLNSTMELFSKRLLQCSRSDPRLAQDIASSILMASLEIPNNIQISLLVLKTVLSARVNPNIVVCKAMVQRLHNFAEQERKLEDFVVAADNYKDYVVFYENQKEYINRVQQKGEQQYVKKIIDLLVQMTFAS